MDDDLVGLTRSDEAALARMLAWFESGGASRRDQRGEPDKQRVYEAIPYINASGATILAYGIFRLTTPTTVDGDMIDNGAAVDGTYRWRYAVNGPDDVINGSRGFYTWADDREKILYDTTSTPAVGEHWGPKSGESKLFQHRPGFIVDGCYDATNGWLWAKQEVPMEVRVKNNTGSDIAAAASGTATLMGGSAGSTDLGLTLTVNNDMTIAWKNTKVGSASNLAGRLQVITWQT